MTMKRGVETFTIKNFVSGSPPIVSTFSLITIKTILE